MTAVAAEMSQDEKDYRKGYQDGSKGISAWNGLPEWERPTAEWMLGNSAAHGDAKRGEPDIEAAVARTRDRWDR